MEYFPISINCLIIKDHLSTLLLVVFINIVIVTSTTIIAF